MNFEDKATFYDKLSRAATKVGRRIGREEADVFFEDLQEYSIEVVTKAIDKALRNRDPEDKYIIMKLLTVPEIRAAVNSVLASPGSQRSGCEKCEETTWILPEGGGLAKRCECWLAAMNSKKIKMEK